MKSINSQVNNRSSGNNVFAAEFYKWFSNEIYPVRLDVSDSQCKRRSIDVTSRTGIIRHIWRNICSHD